VRVLVTGAAGLIGMAARSALTKAGHDVVAVDAASFDRPDPDLHRIAFEDRAGLEWLVDEAEIEAIVHCGAISGPMMAKGEPLKLVAVNIDATAFLLDLARRKAMKRFVFCSSISVYGDVGPEVITEATPLRPTSVYGATKVACEQLIQGMGVEYGLSGVSLRIARVYGPYRRANCHVKNLIENTEAGRPTEIPCDPAFVYHYVYADDVAEAIVVALTRSSLPRREYNVGSGEALTMPRLVARARSALPGMSATLVAGEDDVPDVQVDYDVSAISRDLDWRPRFPIEQGLAAYRDAFRSGAAAP
jgi:UDP-glucuronate 4-epimerase